ncbi:MAG: A/G-specific adenine glycosylase [Alphaproteobacteria bacterium]|jgi:A/G-specific adenine glycosylase
MTARKASRGDPRTTSRKTGPKAGIAKVDSSGVESAGSVDAGAFAVAMLTWYDSARRHLPWRAAPGIRADPYRVWLSEIMLQQTTVATVGPYFTRFMTRWPDVHALAAAPLDAVLTEWQGLGYYARARNLKKCAEMVSRELGGIFPPELEGLLVLPGIGPYTAAAISAIAFDIPATVVDGNVERVIARLYALTAPLPGVKPQLVDLAAGLSPATGPNPRPGDYAQAMMDLGATICTPRSPNCLVCPVAKFCAGRAQGIAADLPKRAKKVPRPTRRAVAWLVHDKSGALLLRRRPETGLLGGMWEIPSSDWIEDGNFDAAPPVPGDWQTAGQVVHVFTHFRLELNVCIAKFTRAQARVFGSDVVWIKRAGLGDYALPTVMKKVIAAGTAG